MKYDSHLRLRLLVCTVVSCVMTMWANDIRFHNLSVKDGLSHVTVYAIYQDETDAMWFGTLEGINRFNGNSITVYHPSQDGTGLSQNEIMAICGNKRGRVYIQALHDLISFDIRKEQFSRIMADSVFNIEYKADTLWVLTTDRLRYRAEGDSVFRTFHTFERNNTAYRPMSITDRGIYLGGHDGITVLSRGHEGGESRLLPGLNIKSLYVDRAGSLWAGTANAGVYRIAGDRIDERFVHQAGNPNSLSDNQVRCITEDHDGNLWMGTYNGLNRYNPTTGRWTRFFSRESSGDAALNSSVFALYTDSDGGIWVGTYYGGVSYCNPTSNYHTFYKADADDDNALNFPIVGMMDYDADGQLWICTEGGGLNRLDVAQGEFTHFPLANRDTGNMKSIWANPANGQIYVGTHSGGLVIVDSRTGRSRVIDKTHGLPDNSINAMQPYGDRLVISTRAGLTALNLATERIEPLSTDSAVMTMATTRAYETFHIDRNGNMWFANWKGGIGRLNLSDGQVRYFDNQTGSDANIGPFRVVHIFEAGDGSLYFATVGSGMFKFNPATEAFEHFSQADNSLYSNYCYYVAETPAGDIAVLHNNGVSFIDADTRKLRYIYQTSDVSFCQGSSIFCAPDGTIYLGGIGGMLALSPNRYGVNGDEQSNYYFDRLTVNNRHIMPDDGTGILSQALSFTESIVLPHDHNNLSIELGAPCFTPEQYKYEYRLEGVDKQWNPLYSPQINYTNLQPGKYRLVVRKLTDANELCAENALDITIRPPFYANGYAYLVYALLLAAVVFAIVRVKTRQAKLRASLEYERREKERIDELDKSKMRFFTNVSHEFRTPLTLIIAQLESLLQLDSLASSVYNRMLRVYKNASHLSSLISELLDVHKYDQGHLKLKVARQDIVSFSRTVYLTFYEYAMTRHITYKFDAHPSELDVWFDAKQLQKVVLNLLSNAFKYTSDGGSIAVKVSSGAQCVRIQVSDTGSGIPKEALDKIFERFYQIEGQSSQFSLGTGIGLSLAKTIVELHHGSLEVESEPGKGSVFTVTLPMGHAHFANDEIADSAAEAPVADEVKFMPLSDEKLPEVTGCDVAATEGRPVLLVVEDNPDVLSMLTEIFAPFYDVRVAHNGQEGLDMATSILPDLIVSDVMMPVMSGKKMCYKLKNNVYTSHIPVVLLTAQSSVEYAIEGYMYGADDYIVKPFNVKLLLARCHNLIHSRRNLMVRTNGVEPQAVPAQSSTAGGISVADQALLDKAGRIITDNFANPDFNMNVLAQELGIGRNKLYMRIKELTGLTPNELTLKMKLDESVRLLDNNPELNISEISDRLGFSSTPYFSKCFKSVYGMSPMSYRNRHKS